MSNCCSIQYLDNSASQKVAEVLGETVHDIVNPEVIPLEISIVGEDAWVQYGKMKKIKTQRILEAIGPRGKSTPAFTV